MKRKSREGRLAIAKLISSKHDTVHTDPGTLHASFAFLWWQRGRPCCLPSDVIFQPNKLVPCKGLHVEVLATAALVQLPCLQVGAGAAHTSVWISHRLSPQCTFTRNPENSLMSLTVLD